MPQVARLAAPFCTKHTHVTIDIQSITSVEIQRGLDKFELDAGLTYLENEPLTHVRKQPLYRERYQFVTNRAGPWGRSESITWVKRRTKRCACSTRACRTAAY
jgi:DNA-binding transcriptional LysR family regulator